MAQKSVVFFILSFQKVLNLYFDTFHYMCKKTHKYIFIHQRQFNSVPRVFTFNCCFVISSSMIARHLLKSVRSWSGVSISVHPCAQRKMETDTPTINNQMHAHADQTKTKSGRDKGWEGSKVKKNRKR